MVREIENDTLLKYELEKRGYSCKIIHFNDLDYSLHTGKEKAKVVVTPWLRYDDNVYHFLRFAKRPYKLVNLQWEQVYSEFGLQIGLVTTAGQALKAKHLCWGENSKERLVSAGGSPENLEIVGAMQMDYGSPLFAEYYLPREALADRFQLDVGKKWNLLISSFAYANYGAKAIATLEKRFNHSLAEQVDVHKRSQALTLDWVEKLLETSDCEFIYRPHPSENVDLRLKAMVEKYPHFHVISDYSVKQWATVCDKVNLWISTSNAELLAMNVDYAIVRPIEVPYKYEVESMRNEEFITDCDSFIRYNQSYGAMSDADIAAKLARIEHYYSYDPSTPAYIRIADYLERLLKNEEGQRFRFSLKQRMKFAKLEFKARIFSDIAKKCYLCGNLKPAERMRLKAPAKESIKNRINQRKQKESIEAGMLDYLRAHDKG